MEMDDGCRNGISFISISLLQVHHHPISIQRHNGKSIPKWGQTITTNNLQSRSSVNPQSILVDMPRICKSWLYGICSGSLRWVVFLYYFWKWKTKAFWFVYAKYWWIGMGFLLRKNRNSWKWMSNAYEWNWIKSILKRFWKLRQNWVWIYNFWSILWCSYSSKGGRFRSSRKSCFNFGSLDDASQKLCKIEKTLKLMLKTSFHVKFTRFQSKLTSSLR